jgi:hypothetical protein
MTILDTTSAPTGPTTTTTATTHRAIPMSRIVGTELCKMFDTRSGSGEWSQRSGAHHVHVGPAPRPHHRRQGHRRSRRCHHHARYPRGLYDLIMGLNRWVLRVVAYAAPMTDVYPPFRLNQGESEPVPPIGPKPSGSEKGSLELVATTPPSPRRWFHHRARLRRETA